MKGPKKTALLKQMKNGTGGQPMKYLIDSIEDLLIEFDEMGFAPTNFLHDHDPEACAIDWKNRLVEALEGYMKQIDIPTRVPTQTNSGVCELEQIKDIARISCNICKSDISQEPCTSELCESVMKDAEAIYNAGYRKQREGEWIICGTFDDFVKCSSCGDKHPWQTATEYKYCPNCGAKMKGATDGKAD